MRSRRMLFAVLQLVAVAVLLGFLGYAFRDSWGEAAPRLRDADPGLLALATLALAAYYVAFVLGWVWILAALGIRVPFRIALQAEMVSMLAKYIPGGVWTPAARIVAMRRFGVTDTRAVLGSIALEAGLSAIAGVLVFVAFLPTVADVDAPLLPLVAFAAVVASLLHPRVFAWLGRRMLRTELPPIPTRTLLAVTAFYAATWVVGGLPLLALVHAVGGDAGLSTTAYLGGVGAVGAIVAVVSVIAPSGLGVREASMYGLLLAVASPPVALATVAVNRVAITVVEAGLLLAGAVIRRRERLPEAAPIPE